MALVASVEECLEAANRINSFVHEFKTDVGAAFISSTLKSDDPEVVALDSPV